MVAEFVSWLHVGCFESLRSGSCGWEEGVVGERKGVYVGVVGLLFYGNECAFIYFFVGM
jgi:hypothetical protein